MFTVNTIKITNMIFIVEGFELLKTIKIVNTMFVAKMLLGSLLLEDVVARNVLTRGCCWQKMANVDVKNVDAKEWLMLMLEMLRQRTLLHAQDVIVRNCYQIKTLL